MRLALALSLCLATAAPARACDIALVLAIDVSGSVDAAEYALQAGGLADALNDPEIVDALVARQAALAVVHWSATRMQALTQDWKRMLDAGDVARFAAAARAEPRAFDGADTAVSNALVFSAGQFDRVPDCRQRVIDISGDGPQNAGVTLGPARGRILDEGIVINAIAIEDMGAAMSVTEFYRRLVISPGGFVVTARGHRDYPAAIRAKLLREITMPSS